MDEAGRADPGPGRLPEVADQLAHVALRMMKDPDSGAVRAEDYLTLLAAAAGEAVLAASGLVDVENPRDGMAPGSVVLGQQINVLLTGDVAAFREAPAGSVAGTIMALTVPGVFAVEDFAVVDGVYQVMLGTLGQGQWGEVVTTVPEANKPRVLPLRAAFELRGVVEQAQDLLGLSPERRHEVCVHALATALRETRQAMAPEISIALSMEVVFAMSKTVPVPRSAISDRQAPAR